MGTRAGRTVAFLGLRCLLRRQLLRSELVPLIGLPHASALSTSAVSSPSSSRSSAERPVDEAQQELRDVGTKLLLDLAAAGVDSGAQKMAVEESLGIGSSGHWWISQSRSTDEWIVGVRSGCRFPSQGIQRWNGETIATPRHGDEAVVFRDQDFVSRYLQWRSYDRAVSLVESQNNTEESGVSAVDMGGGLVSVTIQNCKWSSPGLLLSSSSLHFIQEPSNITPLEASSVKRKRKKKMNKHKQRKLRRRDRHRN